MKNLLSAPGIEYFYKGEQKCGVGPGFYVKSIKYDEEDMIVELGRKTIITEALCSILIIMCITFYCILQFNVFKIRYDVVNVYDSNKGVLFTNIIPEGTIDVPYIVKIYDSDGVIKEVEMNNSTPLLDMDLIVGSESIRVKVFLKYVPFIPILSYSPTVKKIG